MTQADSRPRIHVWPQRSGFAWSIGPTGRQAPAETPGAAVDAALAALGGKADRGFVVIGNEAGR